MTRPPAGSYSAPIPRPIDSIALSGDCPVPSPSSCSYARATFTIPLSTGMSELFARPCRYGSLECRTISATWSSTPDRSITEAPIAAARCRSSRVRNNEAPPGLGSANASCPTPDNNAAYSNASIRASVNPRSLPRATAKLGRPRVLPRTAEPGDLRTPGHRPHRGPISPLRRSKPPERKLRQQQRHHHQRRRPQADQRRPGGQQDTADAHGHTDPGHHNELVAQRRRETVCCSARSPVPHRSAHRMTPGAQDSQQHRADHGSRADQEPFQSRSAGISAAKTAAAQATEIPRRHETTTSHRRPATTRGRIPPPSRCR